MKTWGGFFIFLKIFLFEHLEPFYGVN